MQENKYKVDKINMRVDKSKGVDKGAMKCIALKCDDIYNMIINDMNGSNNWLVCKCQ